MHWKEIPGWMCTGTRPSRGTRGKIHIKGGVLGGGIGTLRFWYGREPGQEGGRRCPDGEPSLLSGRHCPMPDLPKITKVWKSKKKRKRKRTTYYCSGTRKCTGS